MSINVIGKVTNEFCGLEISKNTKEERTTAAQMSFENPNAAFVVGNVLANMIGESPKQPEMKLNLEKFGTHSADGINFDFKKYRNESSTGTSIITHKCWNLSRIEEEPVPDAYFEVTFTEFNPYYKSERVGVGIGNQIFADDYLLGRQQNSFGYFNNGSVMHNSNTHSGLFPGFNENDTIGVGILYDSYNWRRVYFTKNGQYLGVAPIGIHTGQDCFPGVTFENDAYAKFKVNFTGPFKFDAKTLPNHRYDKTNRISNLPDEILFDCINRAAVHYATACTIQKVNKRFSVLAKDNRIWKRLFLATYPFQNPDLKLRSWKKLFERRHVFARNEGSNYRPDSISQQFVENCGFEFECPLSWREMSDYLETDAKEQHCNKCNKTVYAVENVEELQKFTQMGRCVSIVMKEKKRVMRGKFVTRIIDKQ